MSCLYLYLIQFIHSIMSIYFVIYHYVFVCNCDCINYVWNFTYSPSINFCIANIVYLCLCDVCIYIFNCYCRLYTYYECRFVNSLKPAFYIMGTSQDLTDTENDYIFASYNNNPSSFQYLTINLFPLLPQF